MLFKLLLAVVGFGGLSAEAARLNQNDISILMPLPTLLTENQFLKPETVATGGELLPAWLYAKMPPIAMEDPAVTFKKLRVVGIRVDPCFVPAPPRTGCQAQIRMIWQPAHKETETTFRMLDAAVHTFYDLTAEEMTALITDLEKLKDKYQLSGEDEPLSVNPTLRRLGVDSAYARDLFAILLARAGAARMSQATFMQLLDAEDSWAFGGFMVSGSKAEDLTIPRIPGFLQTFTNKPLIFNATYYSKGGMTPAPAPGRDTFTFLIQESRDIGKEQEAEVITAVKGIYRLEDPRRHNAQTADCVSCHAAMPARRWANRQFPWLTLDLVAGVNAYKSRYNLSNTSTYPDNTRMLRAFGYGNVEPAISQRVVNETASVLERLYPPAK